MVRGLGETPRQLNAKETAALVGEWRWARRQMELVEETLQGYLGFADDEMARWLCEGISPFGDKLPEGFADLGAPWRGRECEPAPLRGVVQWLKTWMGLK